VRVESAFLPGCEKSPPLLGVAEKRFGNDAGKLPLFQKGRLPDLLTGCDYGLISQFAYQATLVLAVGISLI
jgi:hypothetical protein